MAKDSFYKFNKADIQGGAGRLIVGDDTTLRPESIEDVMDLTTFELKEGFRDLGATTEGIARTRGYESEDVEIDQSTTPIDSTVSSWENTLATTLMETGIQNRQLANIGGAIVETAAEMGEASTLAAKIAKSARIVKVAAAEAFKDVSYAKIGDETVQIDSIDGNTLNLKKPTKDAHEADESATPIKKLGIKKIGYGAPTSVPAHSLVNIVKRDDGTFLMVYYYEVKLSDNVETNNGKEKATLPVTFTAYAQDDLPEEENVYLEIEQTFDTGK